MLVKELKLHFTQAESTDFFPKVALVTLAVFGILAFLTLFLQPLGTIFGILAISSFILFSLIEVFGWIVGAAYEYGLLNAIGSAILHFCALCVLAIVGAYLMLGGALISGALLYYLPIPKVLTPAAIIFYFIFSLWWAAGGMTAFKHNGTIPPLNMIKIFS